ncbi:hypothetical protein DOTSEDRAFT_75940 [Dothistroma septosporum NZE10]|uniref:C2H2-type domain-containing protein n=1 Tax=Dothistroma septosporum (strain NZE10 / CBS 128990) TaxID=675120 RepID=N1PC44_DOTSN|nr:hypothetical protein DOTSEDRAFT_75940 [Dothistroma septosporum NZE10]
MDAYRSAHLADASQSSFNAINTVDVGGHVWNNDPDDFADWVYDVQETTNNDAAQGLPPTQTMFDHWLSAPNTWDTGPATAWQDTIAPDAGHGSEENDVLHLQRQIDELKATLSAMAEKGQVATAPESAKATSAPTIHPLQRRHARTMSTNARGSFSMNVSGTATPSFRSGFSTPAEGLESPFDYTDESPIYSRRSSVQSNISAPGKRGQRIPGGYRCTQCAANFDLPSTLRHHERKHIAKEQRRHGCNECGRRFLYPKDLARHERNVHKADVAEVAGGQETNSQLQGRGVADQQYPRKRHWEQSQAVIRARSRDRRLTNDFNTSSSLALDMPDVTWPEDVAPGLRRDSIIPDIVTEDTDNAHEVNTDPHVEHLAVAKISSCIDTPHVLAPDTSSVEMARQWLRVIHALLESAPSTAQVRTVRMAAIDMLDQQLDALELEGD